MPAEVPRDHALRKLFRSALDRAFLEYRELYSPDVAEHLEDHILTDFIHTDRLYRLRRIDGARVDELPAMLDVAGENEGPERRLEVDRYIGDFVLFVCGFFPALLRKRRWEPAQPLVTRVGGVLINFEQPFDYYVAEGRNAYTRAAATARLFDPESHHTFRRLGVHLEGYLDLVGAVKRFLETEEPKLRELDGIVGVDDGGDGDESDGV